MTKGDMRKIVWQKTMLLTIEMQHSKSKYLKGKYDAFKEMWEELGGDLKPEAIETTEPAQAV